MEQGFLRALAIRSALLLILTVAFSALSAERSTTLFETTDKENALEIRIQKEKEEIPGIHEYQIQVRNQRPKERTLHGKIIIQDGQNQKECTVYLVLPPSALAKDTIRCQAGDRAAYWQFQVVKVYDLILED